METEMQKFLEECSISGDAAYGAIKGLLERLEKESTRSEARVFLSEIQRRFADSSIECFKKYHFRIHDVWLNDFEGYQKRKKLTMMEIPSIFIPEDWSFTFYEGINRHPDSFFREKTVAELGCGNGWISIALAEKWGPLKVYGLDINPRAVKIAWINLYLNALDENGQPIYDPDGKTLLDRVEFHESDLLAYCRVNKIELERIVGCIPQILNPNPEAMSKVITETSSEEFLYDLSNYCALQGFVEDQFGLGLIARAVEEGIAVIKPMGFMVFNMGGRPGQGVCRRLFERRGLRISKIWETKVMQAADTDISALVEIEKNSPHRFEFFMGLVADQPICARTASAYMKFGGRISHSLSVYSCQLRQPNQVKKIFEFLKDGFQEVSSSLDLSFEDESVADEKIPFLADLATLFRKQSFLPYDSPAGWLNFRSWIAGFMKNYHRIPLTADNVVVFPTRTVAIENVLRLFSPRLAIVDDHLTKHLPKQWLTSLALEGSGENEVEEITVIEAPHRSDLLIELIKKLKPQIVITGMAHFEAITSSAFENLLSTTREIGSRLFLDISDHLELSSLPSSNGVLKYLTSHTLPSHAAILCGLVKNQVYSDLEVAFIISEDAAIQEGLSKTVELLEDHTALFSQHYYGCLFHELLAFQINDRHPILERECTDKGSTTMIGFCPSATSTFNGSEFFIHAPQSTNPSTVVHMDLDQNILPIPSVVKASIFESFARQNMVESETDVGSGIKQLLKSQYGYPSDTLSEVICGNSCLALFNKLVLSCINEKGTFLFPMGTNGHYLSAAQFMKCNVGTIPTTPQTGFKLSPEALKDALKTVERPWVYISGPTVNPTGSVYSDSEINSLLDVCVEYGARVVIDTSFSGLEFEAGSGSTVWNLKQGISNLAGSQKNFCLILLGGLSFELLAGGFDFGFLVLNEPDPDLAESVGNFFRGLSRPHGISKYAVRKLLGLKNGADERLLEAIKEQKESLKNRAEALTKTLTSCGWDVIGCHGGVSLVAKPTEYLGKTVKIDNSAATLDGSNIREALLKSTGLCINGASWTRLPDYCRFSFSVEQAKFDQSLDQIIQFKKLVFGA
ncbi:hypothetical protein LUZ63_004001 [Rhynchospora breviuscula]|uniref:methionine S-methyltransferase n=1 Tax=Rhynchospora breviuscula TaxID=2022672 RepID=A0A9Q0D1Q4_9POAL|nr:hypothetical protein LUZ63_004001 [Rhynchospora breviuscula]